MTGWAAAGDSIARVLVRLRLSSTGLVVAVLFVCLSLTPSLLPRTWLVQGFVSGISAAVGYAIGVAVAWAWRRSAHGWSPFGDRSRRWLRMGVPAITAGLLAMSMYYGSLWQDGLYALLGESRPGRLGYVRVLLVTVVLMAVAIASARAVGALVRLANRLARVWLPATPASIMGALIAGLVCVMVLEGVLGNAVLFIATSASATADSVTPGAVMPTSPTRSGSPQSLVSWDSLGREGRSFVAGGPTLAQLREFDGPQAKQPIRVYVGLDSAPTVDAAAALAVRELERTDAAERSVLCVVTTTGTGWIDPYAAAALEYVAGGDTAIVGTQYSFLPSWISFLSERDRVAQAGRAIFEHVYAYWSALPPAHRPKLLVYGESLGSLGSESAFQSLDDLRHRTDGALWMGPTNDNPLWAGLVAGRDPGSSEVLPIYRDGRAVRFASRPQDLDQPTGPWQFPRVVYLQNASDPVTWWSPRLLFHRPDWLAEPRGYDVQPAMQWHPILTFLQVTADLVLAQRTRATHGHYFHGATVAAWAGLIEPPGWTAARSAELTQRLDTA